jgi:predicted transcriptional regulator
MAKRGRPRKMTVNTVSKTLEIPTDWAMALRHVARKEVTSDSDIIRRAIRDYLNKLGFSFN